MRRDALALREDEVEGLLLPRLVGRVFHVTCLSTVARILEAQAILPNTAGTFQSPFGSTNAFFKQRGCVSVFDYRSASSEQLWQSIHKCSPFRLPSCGHRIGVFFLSKSTHDRLIPWTEWKEQQSWSDKIVPYVEAGYPGAIPLGALDELLEVTFELDRDPLVEALQRGREQAGEQSDAADERRSASDGRRSQLI